MAARLVHVAPDVLRGFERYSPQRLSLSQSSPMCARSLIVSSVRATPGIAVPADGRSCPADPVPSCQTSRIRPDRHRTRAVHPAHTPLSEGVRQIGISPSIFLCSVFAALPSPGGG